MRDLLMKGQEGIDIDIATSNKVDKVISILKNNNIKYIDSHKKYRGIALENIHLGLFLAKCL